MIFIQQLRDLRNYLKDLRVRCQNRISRSYMRQNQFNYQIKVSKRINFMIMAAQSYLELQTRGDSFMK